MEVANRCRVTGEGQPYSKGRRPCDCLRGLPGARAPRQFPSDTSLCRRRCGHVILEDPSSRSCHYRYICAAVETRESAGLPDWQPPWSERGDPQTARAAQELGEWSCRARMVRCNEEPVGQRQQRDAENAEAHVGEGAENRVSVGLRELDGEIPSPHECNDLR